MKRCMHEEKKWNEMKWKTRQHALMPTINKLLKSHKKKIITLKNNRTERDRGREREREWNLTYKTQQSKRNVKLTLHIFMHTHMHTYVCHMYCMYVYVETWKPYSIINIHMYAYMYIYPCIYLFIENNKI